MSARRGRRSPGEGAVYQRKSDGLWVGMLDLGLVGGKRRRKTGYGQTEAQASPTATPSRSSGAYGWTSSPPLMCSG
jgi:hypothetical protein